MYTHGIVLYVAMVHSYLFSETIFTDVTTWLLDNSRQRLAILSIIINNTNDINSITGRVLLAHEFTKILLS